MYVFSGLACSGQVSECVDGGGQPWAPVILTGCPWPRHHGRQPPLRSTQPLTLVIGGLLGVPGRVGTIFAYGGLCGAIRLRCALLAKASWTTQQRPTFVRWPQSRHHSRPISTRVEPRARDILSELWSSGRHRAVFSCPAVSVPVSVQPQGAD